MKKQSKHYIYKIISNDGVLYVGETHDYMARLWQHINTKWFIGEDYEFIYAECKNKDIACEYETYYINKDKAKFNIAKVGKSPRIRITRDLRFISLGKLIDWVEKRNKETIEKNEKLKLNRDDKKLRYKIGFKKYFGIESYDDVKTNLNYNLLKLDYEEDWDNYDYFYRTFGSCFTMQERIKVSREKSIKNLPDFKNVLEFKTFMHRMFEHFDNSKGLLRIVNILYNDKLLYKRNDIIKFIESEASSIDLQSIDCKYYLLIKDGIDKYAGYCCELIINN